MEQTSRCVSDGEGASGPASTATPMVSTPGPDDGPPMMTEQDYLDLIACHHYDDESLVAEDNPAPLEEPPFKVMGYDNGTFYYLPRGAGQVVALTPERHKQTSLWQLAPAGWWMKNFPKKNADGEVTGILWGRATNSLIQSAYKTGIFKKAQTLRGAGIWMDKRRIVVHMGDKLLVDGVEREPFSFNSRHVYQKSEDVIALAPDGLTDAEAEEFCEIVDMVSWGDPMHGTFLVGWCVTAALSGALDWRPHVYISAQEGAGKSWLSREILSPVFGDYAIKLTSGTTEPGLRRLISHDAKPVMLDEMEGEDRRQQETRKAIMLMTRKSSSGDKLVQANVKSDGVVQFNLYSSFLISSINIGVKESADLDRFVRLEIRKRDDRDKFREMQRRVATLIGDDFSYKFMRRVVDNTPTVLANVKTYSSVVADLVGDTRSGEQLGSLLAGHALMRGWGLVSEETARQWCIANDIARFSEARKQPSHNMLFDYLMSCIVTVHRGRREEHQIGKLISIVIDNPDEFEFLAALELHDIRIIGNYVCIRKPSQHIDRLLRDTPWKDSWATTIARISGVISTRHPERFGKKNARQIKIPISMFKEDAHPDLKGSINLEGGK